MIRHTVHIVVILAMLAASRLAVGQADHPNRIKADLLIVGGTESGCAAAVQAARSGVEHIVLVNDTRWLGGQFSSEALGAIDENRGPAGYGHGVPFPRAGLFREVIDSIEQLNQRQYGHPRPGNTRVITTCRPRDAAHAFAEWLRPLREAGRIRIFAPYFPKSVRLAADGSTVQAVAFQRDPHGQSIPEEDVDAPLNFIVEAPLTIDASDWGDVIKLAGAEFDCGPDLQSKYGEPLAPESHQDYPHTDMNPITYCLVLEKNRNSQVIDKPATYRQASYEEHPYPPSLEFLYTSRRLIDGQSTATSVETDVVLICFPLIDYPLDVLPQRVIDRLEADERGASRKNIVELTRRQRQIIFDDAKLHSLGFLYYLQTVASAKNPPQRYDFRHLSLSDEFGTPDSMPPKPYVRESLRLRAMYMMKQQDTAGAGGDSRNYGSAMYEDGVACWQFEYDFHPTGRRFVDPQDRNGAWRGYLKPLRKWGPPYSGRCLFPARSLVPARVDGLLGAQKNLGYSSVVSSAVRLHDQSMAIGAAAGAVAAVSIRHHVQPRNIPGDRLKLAEVWHALCHEHPSQVPATLWPFRDLDPLHPAFVAINQLAIRRAFPLRADEADFLPDQTADAAWIEEVERRTRTVKLLPPSVKAPQDRTTRAAFARQWWHLVRDYPDRPFPRGRHPHDFDDDGISNSLDPLPWTKGVTSWPDYQKRPEQDGMPPPLKPGDCVVRIDFGSSRTTPWKGFQRDFGAPYDDSRGYGWQRDLRQSVRERGRLTGPHDTFVFTRTHDVWECRHPPGQYRVTVCVGDSGHAQQGQNVTVEGKTVFENVSTPEGVFYEAEVLVEVRDGKLTVEIGKQGSTTNTCLNWLISR